MIKDDVCEWSNQKRFAIYLASLENFLTGLGPIINAVSATSAKPKEGFFTRVKRIWAHLTCIYRIREKIKIDMLTGNGDDCLPSDLRVNLISIMKCVWGEYALQKQAALDAETTTFTLTLRQTYKPVFPNQCTGNHAQKTAVRYAGSNWNESATINWSVLVQKGAKSKFNTNWDILIIYFLSSLILQKCWNILE